MSAPITPNEKAAAGTNCDGLNYVSTTTFNTLGKDRTDGHYHDCRVKV